MDNILSFDKYNLLEGRGYAVSIDRLHAANSTLRRCVMDMDTEQYSYTEAPLDVWKNEDGKLHVVDGYHRLFEALLIGKKWLKVYTSGEGYSSYWSLAEGDNVFKGDSSLRYGGLENIISVKKLDSLYKQYLAKKGDGVLNFEVDLPKRKPAVRKKVDKLAGLMSYITTVRSIRMAPDLVSFTELLKFITKETKPTKATMQRAIESIVTHDNPTFFVKLEEMPEWGFLFKNYLNKVIFDKGEKADKFYLANFNDSWLPRLVNSEAR